MVSARAYSNKRGRWSDRAVRRGGVVTVEQRKGEKKHQSSNPLFTVLGSLDPGWVVRPPIAPEQVGRGQQQ